MSTFWCASTCGMRFQPRDSYLRHVMGCRSVLSAAAKAAEREYEREAVARDPVKAADQLLLIAPDTSEGVAPRRPGRRR